MLEQPAQYAAWLTYVFDTPETPSGWYWYADTPPYPEDPVTVSALVHYTLVHCGRDLARFDDRQVYEGLSFIFNNSCSDTVFALTHDSIPLDTKLAVIDSVRTLYTDCFAPRCAPVLGHLDEPGGSWLNTICYMLWDVSPLGWWRNHHDATRLYAAVLAVLDFALDSPNDACVESALHGLGHLHLERPVDVPTIIARFRQRRTTIRPELAGYAAAAATGCVL